MSGWIKNGGAWKEILKVFRRTSAIWQPVWRIHSKETSGWELLWKPKYIPPNLIVMGSSSLASMDNWLLGGGSAYADKFLMGGVNGAAGGAATHLGSAHGNLYSYVTNHVSNYRHAGWTVFWSEPAGGTQSSHNHTIQHTHGGTGSNIPLNTKLTPYIVNSNGLINAGGLFLTELSTAPTNFTMVSTYSGRWLKFHSTPGNGSESGSHTHYIAMNTSTVTMSSDGSNNDSSNWDRAHYHSASHTHTWVNNPSYTTLRLMRSDNDIDDQDNIPIGTIAPFTDGDIPGGWERYTFADGTLMKLLNAATTSGGASNHGHRDDVFNTGGKVVTWSSDGDTSSTTRYTYNNAHTHTMNHSHASYVTSMPAYKEIHFAKKIS